MLTDRSKEFISILHKMKCLMHKARPVKSIPHGEFMLLTAIDHAIQKHAEKTPGIKVSELAKRMEVTMPAVSKMLSLVEEKNYIERITDRSDRRVVYINLTDNGKNIIETASEKMEEMTNRVLGAMGEEDTETLVRLLNKLYIILERENKM